MSDVGVAIHAHHSGVPIVSPPKGDEHRGSGRHDRSGVPADDAAPNQGEPDEPDSVAPRSETESRPSGTWSPPMTPRTSSAVDTA